MTNTQPTTRLAGALVLALAGLALPVAAQNDAVFRLVRRTTNGMTRAEIQAAEAMGFDAFLASQLNYAALPDVESVIATNFPLVFQSPHYIRTNYGSSANGRAEPQRQMRQARVWRWVYSDQGLRERMAWQWANTVSIDQGKGFGYALMPWYDEYVNRKHGLGFFRDLLHASAGDSPDRAAAMLEYLDNDNNDCTASGANPNENYAREFMELHGLGKEPQIYDEANVVELATILSGWDYVKDQNNIRWGLFDFVSGQHCDATTFLGTPVTVTGKAQGQTAIDLVVDYVDPVHGRICPQFLAKRLVRAFLTDVPPPPGSPEEAAINAAIADATAAFGVDGDIPAMLDAILSEARINAVLNGTTPLYKYMPPWLFLSSLLRASEATIDINLIRSVTKELDELGQPPYGFGPPIGYPESIGAWVQDQPGRWSFAYRLFENSIIGVTVNVPALYAPFVNGFDRATAAQQASEILTAGHMSSGDLQIIQRYVNLSPLSDAVISWKVLALCALAPSFNLY